MFVEKFEKVKDVVGELLDEIQAERAPLVLYGAGCCVTMFLNLLEESDINIVNIVDNDPEKWGKVVRGVEINSWEIVKATYPDMQIVITTSHFEDIKYILREKGFNGKIYHLPMNAYYQSSVYSRLFIKKYEKRFQRVYEQFADDISREVYINFLKHNMSFDDQYFASIQKYEIRGYFGTKLFENKEDEVIVDGGAFDGDTVKEFFSIPERRCKRIYSFEPDTGNFQKLCSKVKNDKVFPIHAGLGKVQTTSNFIMGGGIASRVDSEGTEQVTIECIDHVLGDEKPTFIKMDIEGAEADALLGGKEVIGKYLPMLAISAYHKMRDIFELVELIDELGSGNYDIYLRHTFYYQKVMMQPDVIIYAKKKNKKCL